MPKRSQRHRIFVVDDEHMIAWTLAEILRRKGFDASPFTHPLEALRAARSWPPDLLISDQVMTQMSGVELARSVLQFCPDCEVLIISGQAAISESIASASPGPNTFGVVSKPVHPEELLKRIHAILRRC
jgi:DNA-binding response OmpR family regulator